MIIKLNVITDDNFGTCAQIYAFAEPNEEGWAYNARSVKICHNPEVRGIGTPLKLLMNCDNDRSISFHSKVPFAKFCSQFEASEYNDPKNYSLFFHNCANGAHYALELAEIGIPSLSTMKLMHISPDSLTPIPGPTLTPISLYKMACEHKKTEAETCSRVLSTVGFKAELASSSLLFWSKKEKSPEKRQNVDTIVSEINRSIELRPHHSEQYIATMIDTIDLLMRATTQEDSQQYAKLAYGFRERPIFRSNMDVGITVALSFSVSILRSILDSRDNPWQFPINLASSILIPNLTFDWLKLLPAAFAAGYYLHASIHNQRIGSKEPVETRLSSAVSFLGESYLMRQSLIN